MRVLQHPVFGSLALNFPNPRPFPGGKRRSVPVIVLGAEGLQIKTCQVEVILPLGFGYLLEPGATV
jgi:hypothetical protein